jgi:hypothetical protein
VPYIGSATLRNAEEQSVRGNVGDRSMNPSAAPANRLGSIAFDLAVSAILVTLATLIRMALDPILGNQYPFAPYFAAVATAACVC